MAQIELNTRTANNEPVSKWQALRDVTTARKRLGLSDRTINVLNALLSFHKGEDLGHGDPVVVFPSNRTLGERAHGMAESTLRRHLAALVDAGLILRHDSPNGKRFARRGPGGVIALAFGFDLWPLVQRAAELSDLAQEVRDTELRLKLLRERCLLMLRDAAKLMAFETEHGAGHCGNLFEQLSDCQRRLRHKPTLAGLSLLELDASELLDRVRSTLAEDTETEEPSGYDSQNERHQQSSEPEYLDSELTEKAEQAKPNHGMPLPIVLKACDEIHLYARDGIRDWADFIRVVAYVRTMMGISDDAWDAACRTMGACDAACVVACLLQRVEHIKSPGGYLRVLTAKAAESEFSVGPMVMALLNSATGKAA